MGNRETSVKMSSMAALLVISLCVLISGCLAAPNQDLDVGQARANGDINLSDLYASPYFGPLAIITLFVFVDVFLMVFFVGETNKNRRRAGAYYRPPVPHKRHHHAARGHHYRHHRQPYYGGGVGRMGDAEGEEIDELQSLDWVDSTFGLMNIESQVCRERAICELERKASENAFFGFIVKNLNSYVNGLDKYERAIEEGLNGRSCEEIFAECPYSLGQPSSWNLFSKK